MNTNYNAIKSELKVLGNIQEGHKLYQDQEGHFIEAKPSNCYKNPINTFSRFLSSQGQEKALNGLANLIDRINSLVGNGISEKQNLKLGVLLKNAENGLNLLKVTYKDKQETLDRIDQVIQNLNILFPEERSNPLTLVDSFVEVLPDDKNLENLENQLQSMLNPHAIVTEVSKPLTPVTVEDLKAVLKKSFNDSLVDEMVEIYKFSGIVTPKEVNALLVGIVANLTYNDIQQIIEKKEGIAYDKIKDIVDNGEMTEDKLLAILDRLRDVRILNPKHLPHIASQYGADRAFLADCTFGEAYKMRGDDKLIKNIYGNAEHLSRGYVYDLFETEAHQFREGILFPIYEDGKRVCRQVNSIFNKDAVMAMAVSPIRELSESKKIQVVFRGTYDGVSVMRDFDPREGTGFYEGPGLIYYKHYEKDLLESFNNFFVEHRDATDLEIMGHSLGATDAQRFLLTLSNDMVENNQKWSNINNVKIFGFNPPGVIDSDAKKFYENVKQLESKNFDVNYLSTHGDIVHMFGNHLLGCSKEIDEKAENLRRTFVRFHFPGITHGNFLQEDVLGGQSIAPNMNNTAIKAATRSYKAHSLRYFVPNPKDYSAKVKEYYPLPKLYAFGSDHEVKQGLINDFNLEMPLHIQGTNNLDLAMVNHFDLPYFQDILPKMELTNEDRELRRQVELIEQKQMIV